jgi:signal transduction histidine kinase
MNAAGACDKLASKLPWEAGLAERAARDEFEYSVATLPSTPQHRRLAFAVVGVTLAAYGAALPFAGTPLPRIDSFIPIVMTIVFVTDLVTAVLLFGQFSATGSRALLMLASGYLFSSLTTIPYSLTFPGAFAPTGLLGAGPQSAPWINISSRFGLAVATVGYALLTSGKPTKDLIELSPRPAILWSVAIVIIVVCALTSAVTAGHDFMPPALDDMNILPSAYYANGMSALTNVIALLLLWYRGKSVLDLWLMVAVGAMIVETATIALLVPVRFSVGWYANRVIAMLVSKVVLIVLLSETVILHTSLSIANWKLSIANRNLQRERENKLTNAQAVVAAIAHEVRQPLAGISSQAAAGRRFLDRASPDVDRAKGLFEQIKGAAFRANEVFENFLSLFRGGKQEHQPVDMNGLALAAVELLRKELDDHNITTLTKLASELPVIQGNAGQLREVILNLVQNSIEAMATTTNTSRIISVVTARAGSNSIAVSIEDTGPGIDPQKISSIYDAFFTTKPSGTGLGLAICKMIVEQHGGELSATSEADGGARFEITLPTKTAT